MRTLMLNVDFSTKGNILTEEHTLLSERSINGLYMTYNAVQYLNYGSAHKVNSYINY